MGRLIPAVESLACHQLLLEFAIREMAELDTLNSNSERQGLHLHPRPAPALDIDLGFRYGLGLFMPVDD